MSKYVNLDISIMSKLSDTPSPFSRLFSGDVGAECVDIAKDEGDKKEPFRILDRRLQALRKLGVIAHVKGKGWVKYERRNHRSGQRAGRAPAGNDHPEHAHQPCGSFSYSPPRLRGRNTRAETGTGGGLSALR